MLSANVRRSHTRGSLLAGPVESPIGDSSIGVWKPQ